MFDEYVEVGSKKGGRGLWKVLLILLIISSLFAVSYATHFGLPVRWHIPEFNIETLPPTDIGTNHVTLHGNLSLTNLLNVTVYFQYGKHKGKYLYKTDNKTISSVGNFSQKVEGIQLIPDTTYYYRAVGHGSGTYYGEELNFTTKQLTPIKERNFSKHYKEVEESNFNMSKLSTALAKTYTDVMLESRIFYGLFFGFIFLAIWIRQEDVTIPALLGIMIGGTIWYFLPGQWMKIAQSLMIISIVGLLYTLVKGRR